MPKMKTHKVTAKRFKVTGTGKILRTHIGKSHLRRRAAKRVRRSFDKYELVTNNSFRRRIQKLAPYLR
ncbi:MAG: 50S ribosomal protein L35 [Ardenticatenales bacterium]|nr:50S ribosomal protein L35 [Ardenticatenales bacterium]